MLKVWLKFSLIGSWLLLTVVSCELQLAPRRFVVFGIGVERFDLVYPARYFHVQLVLENGLNASKPPESDYIKVKFNGETYEREDLCVVKSEVIDKRDGSYIVRYRLFTSCDWLKMEITTSRGQRVAASPYLFRGESQIHHEECNCPIWTSSDWLEASDCPKESVQLTDDFQLWSERSVDFNSVLAEAKDRFDNGLFAVCHYQIVNNKCLGKDDRFKVFSDAILTSILRKMRLDNTEFLLNIGDWPVEHKGKAELPLPIFSWCGSYGTKDIVLPSYELTHRLLEIMAIVKHNCGNHENPDIQVALSLDAYDWSDKIDKAIWRGTDTKKIRLELVKLSRENPALLDAKITLFSYSDKATAELYGPTASRLEFTEFFKYKYQINVDGQVAAYRLGSLLASHSLVLKQKSPYYEHYYHKLKPWTHYVPFQRNLSDLIETINWARANPEKSTQIAQNAREFIKEELTTKNIYCHYVQAIRKYTKLLHSPPTQPDKQLAEVGHPEKRLPCRCHLKEYRDPELYRDEL